MITGFHSILYAEDAEGAREFFRDVLGFDWVDAGHGWLIFRLPPAELAMHPTSGEASSGQPELYLMCDDVHATVAELTAKGVTFTSPVTEAGFGLVTTLAVPGAGEIGLYEPRHPTAI